MVKPRDKSLKSNLNDRPNLLKKKARITKSYLYEAATYEINMAKWKAVSEFAKDNGIEFKIITEDELGIKQHGRGTGRVSKPTP